jgi:Fur family ferric uptake transcriptional regulator
MLAQMGQRITRARRAVVEGLCAADGPVTVRQLHATLHAVDLVTVYRTLNWLVELGVAREVAAIPGAERFELITDEPHVHHLHCERCGRLFTTTLCGLDEAVYARIRRAFGFVVSGHTLTFHGLCADCRRLGAAEPLPGPRPRRPSASVAPPHI